MGVRWPGGISRQDFTDLTTMFLLKLDQIGPYPEMKWEGCRFPQRRDFFLEAEDTAWRLVEGLERAGLLTVWF